MMGLALRLLRIHLVGISLLVPAVVHAQAPATPAPAIEGFSGILFFCKPLVNEAWTQRVCDEAATEMASWASRLKRPIAQLNRNDTRQTYSERARAAGFDSKNGLYVLLTIEPRANPAGWDLNARADGISTLQPVPSTPQTTTYTKSEILARSIPVDEAIGRGKRILGSIMFVLSVPMRPL